MKTVVLALTALLIAAPAAQAYDPYAPNSVVREQRNDYVAPRQRPPLKTFELIIKNRTEEDIVAVYAKNVFMNNYSVDLIPNYSIRPGRQGLVNLFDPDNATCEWAVRIRSVSGVITNRSLNVCNTNSLTIY